MSEEVKTNVNNNKFKIIREIIAIILWCYIFIKIFFFDFDNYLINKYFPNLQIILQLKFFVLLGSITIFWIFLKNKVFFQSIFYIITYPLYFVFWRIGKLFYKNWVSAFAFMGLLIVYFKSIRINFITGSIFIISCLLILLNIRFVISLASMIYVFSYLIFHYIKKFYFTINPSKYTHDMSNMIIKGWQKLENINLFRNVVAEKNVIILTPIEKQNRNTSLQLLTLFNKFCYFTASKINKFQEIKYVLPYIIVSILYTLFLTIIAFSFLNFGLYKLDATVYHTLDIKSFPYFIYYSFVTIFHIGIPDFYPINIWSQLLYIAEIFFGFLIFVIIISFIATVKRQKYESDVTELCKSMEKQGVVLELHLKSEFNMTVDDAINEIKNVENSMIKIIDYFSTRIE